MVFFHHFGATTIAAGTWTSALSDLLREFHVGVSVFFVLSGFMITYRYYEDVRMNQGWWFAYIRARVARIYPMYLLITLVTFVVLGKLGSLDFWLNVTLLKGFFNDFKFTGIAQAWSLTVEECFYFSAPLLFLFAKRRLIWIPLLALPLLGYSLIDLRLPGGFLQNERFMLLYTFFGRVVEFFIGMGLAVAFLNGSLRRLLRRVPAGLLTWGGLAGFMAGICWMASLQPSASDVSAVGHFAPIGLFHPWGIVLNNLVIPLAVAAFYAGLLTESTWIKGLLASPTLVLLGQSSYTFYLIHYGVIQDYLSRITGSGTLVLFVFLNVLSVILFKYVEEPLNRMIRGKRVELLAAQTDLRYDSTIHPKRESV